MRARLQLLVLLLFLLPGTAHSLSVAISPNCGTTASHFVVSVGGAPGTPYPCPDSCHIIVRVAIDGVGTIYQTDCKSAFSIDLHNVPNRPPGEECVACGLSVGQHVVTVTAPFNVECTGDTEARPALCASATFEVVGSGEVADPWADDLTSASRGMRVAFFSGGACDVPKCDSIQLVQSIRVRGVKSNGDSLSSDLCRPEVATRC
jgi:hypothetical protein